MHEEGSFAAAIICSSARGLAAGIVARQVARDPVAVAEYGTGAEALALDTEVRLCYLAEALATDRVALFVEQLRWVKVLCSARGVHDAAIQANLECMIEELQASLPEPVVDQAVAMIRLAAEQVAVAPAEMPSFLAEDGEHVDLARQFLLAVLEARERDATRLVLDAFDRGVPPFELYEHVLQRVQKEVGRMWQMDEVTIAEEHYCTGIVTAIMMTMRSRAELAESNGRRVITATVSNETHALGIEVVSQAFESNGWTVISLGADTPAIAIAEAVRDFGCDLIALSANMVLYVRQTADLIASLRAHPVTANTPILVGGQPFNLVDDLWQLVGADGFARSAVECPAVAELLLAPRS
ncbi:MAG: methanogenic corrinoid protein MtbC1 [Planctomycetota bacterium]|jgi:methanogenic corrinoid protein MtbC1